MVTAPALHVADISGVSAKSRHTAHPRHRHRPDQHLHLTQERRLAVRKVEIGSKNFVELEERAGLYLNQRHRGLEWKELSETTQSKLSAGVGVPF